MVQTRIYTAYERSMKLSEWQNPDQERTNQKARIFYLRFGTVQLKGLANQIMSPEPTFSSVKKNGAGDSGEFLLTHAHKSDLPVQLEAPWTAFDSPSLSSLLLPV